MALLTCHFFSPGAGGRAPRIPHPTPGSGWRRPLSIRSGPAHGGLFSFALFLHPSSPLFPPPAPLSFFFDIDFVALLFLSLSLSLISLLPSLTLYSFPGLVSITPQPCEPASDWVSWDLGFFICQGGIVTCISRDCERDSVARCSVAPRERRTQSGRRPLLTLQLRTKPLNWAPSGEGAGLLPSCDGMMLFKGTTRDSSDH